MTKKREPWPHTPPDLKILREPQVLAFCGMKKSQFWDHVKKGDFPKPIKLTETGYAVGWLLEELIEWREQRIAARDDANAPTTPTPVMSIESNQVAS